MASTSETSLQWGKKGHPSQIPSLREVGSGHHRSQWQAFDVYLLPMWKAQSCTSHQLCPVSILPHQLAWHHVITDIPHHSLAPHLTLPHEVPHQPHVPPHYATSQDTWSHVMTHHHFTLTPHQLHSMQPHQIATSYYHITISTSSYHITPPSH